jgi:hypothetical protein
MNMRIESEINWSTFPVNLERIRFVWEAGNRWAIIRKEFEVFILTRYPLPFGIGCRLSY